MARGPTDSGRDGSRRTRRDILAGIAGGAAALAADAVIDAVDHETSSPTGGSLAGLPIEVGKETSEIPFGPS